MSQQNNSGNRIRQFLLKLSPRPKGKEKEEKINWVTMSVSFLFAVTLWFIVALNKQDYKNWFSQPVKLVNFPKKYQLLQPFPSRIDVLAEGHGIDLLLYSFSDRKDTVKIDFSLFEGKGQFVAIDNLPILSRGLPRNLTAINSLPPIIHLEYNIKAFRLVPVIANIQLKMQDGYRIFGGISLEPDSVVVVGPKALLDTLSGFKTERRILEPKNERVTEYLKMESHEPFEVVQEEVKISFEALAFTEATNRVKVQVHNLPPGIELELVPDSITVKYLVPLKEFEKWQKKSFEVSVDYEQIKPGLTKYLYPNIKAPDPETEITLIEPARLDFSVVRRR